MDKYTKLLEVYTLDELLEFMSLEHRDLLELLDELGYLIEIPEPL